MLFLYPPPPWRPQRDLTIPWSDTPSPSRIFCLIAVTPGARGAFCSGDLKLLSPPPSLGVTGQLCHSNTSRPNSALGRGGIRNPVPRCLALANQRLRPRVLWAWSLSLICKTCQVTLLYVLVAWTLIGIPIQDIQFKTLNLMVLSQ